MNFPIHAYIDWSPKYRILLAAYMEEIGNFRAKGGKQEYEIHEKHWVRIAKEWARAQGWKQSNSRQTPLEFLKGRAFSDVPLLDADHVTLWNKDGQPIAVTSQPYADRSYSLGAVADPETFQLEHSITRHRIPYSGWHNFPRTHLDVWMRD